MYRLLLVDDEFLVREAISENIHWNELGYQLVSICENGKEAMEYIKEFQVDVVMTDICMPFVDGIELSRYIHENYPKISVIIFSGYDEFEYAKKAIKYGVSEYLLKPVTRDELSDILISLKEKIDKKREKESEFNKLSGSYFKNRILIQSKIIENLIMGNQTEEESRREIEEYGLHMDYLEYRIAIIEIDIYSDLYNVNEDKIKQGEMKSFVIYNISNEIMKKYEAGEVCKEDNNRGLLLFWTNYPRELEQKIRIICKEIQEAVYKVLKSTVTIGIGEKVHSLADLHKSYYDAADMLIYRYLWDENQIFDREKLQNQLEGNVKLDNIIEQVILSVKLKEMGQIEKNLIRIQELFKESYTGRNKVCLHLYQIVTKTCDLLKASDLTEEFIYQTKENAITCITGARSLTEAMCVLKKFCHMACEELDKQKNSSGNKQAMLANDYIEKHYGDFDLTLNSICSYLCISTSHFSSIFKIYTGDTFMEVLIRTRMQKAMELLENTNLRNYEIAEKVGFRDPHYFSIAFKKMTGKSPKEYAKEKRK